MQGAVQGARVLRIMFAIGPCERGVEGAVPGAPDQVCHWAVSSHKYKLFSKRDRPPPATNRAIMNGCDQRAGRLLSPQVL